MCLGKREYVWQFATVANGHTPPACKLAGATTVTQLTGIRSGLAGLRASRVPDQHTPTVRRAELCEVASVQADGSHVPVVGWRMVLGEVICQVAFPFEPMYSKFAVFHSVLDPVETHVHCFGSPDFGATVGESICGGVVCR